MAERRRYTKRDKLAAVMAAEMAGVTQAGETTGIPKTTIQYWLSQPEFAHVRTRTREDLADEVKAVAHLAWKRIAEAMHEMEPRDAIFAAEKASSLMLLLRGEATERTEVRDITDDLGDDEKRRLAEWARGLPADTAGTAEGVAAGPAVADPGTTEPAPA